MVLVNQANVSIGDRDPKIGPMIKKAASNGYLSFGGLVAGLLTFGSATLTDVTAAERTGINLGTTSFFDGFAGTEPGCTYIQYLGRDTFNTINGSDGSKALDAHLEVNYALPQFTCNSDYKLFGGTLGLDTVVAFLGQYCNFFSTNGFGAGDVLMGPYIQFPPVKSNGREIFSQGFEFDIIMPTGSYAASTTINPGTGFWSIAPFWKRLGFRLPNGK